MVRDSNSLGRLSLWCSTGGLLLAACPFLLDLLGFFLVAKLHVELPDIVSGIILLASPICLLIFVALELVAIWHGLAALPTATGRAGLLVAGISLLVVGLWVSHNWQPGLGKGFDL
jgi:hypothetical protein